MAKTPKVKRLNLIAVSAVLSFCAAGGLTSLLHHGCYLLGGQATLPIIAVFVVVLAVYVGLMSPQWVIRGLLRMRHVAGRWLHHRQDDTALWLPDSRADFATVILVTQGSIVLFALLNVLAGFSASYWVDVYESILDHFFFPIQALYVCDFLFLMILLGPAWFVGGVLLALLHRLALTLDEDRTHPHAEPVLPVCLAAGFGAGLCAWAIPTRFFPSNPVGLWLSQLLALLTVITLLAHTTLPNRQYSRMFKAASANLEMVSSGRAKAALALWLIGGLAGAAWLLQHHLLVLAEAPIAHWSGFHGATFLALALGFLVSRPQSRLRRLGAGPGLALALFSWAGIMLVGLIIYDVVWQIGTPQSNTGMILRILVLTLWLAGSIGLGIALHFGKQMLAHVVTSRSLSWALWLGHSGAGLCLGGVLALYLLPTLGSLMTLTVLILIALLIGGIRAIYCTVSAVWQRRVLVFAGFAMVALSSVVVPWAGRDWLRREQDTRAKIMETLGQGWLIKQTDSKTQLRIEPLTCRKHDFDQQRIQSDAREQILKRTLTRRSYRNCLLVYQSSAFDWPTLMGSDLTSNRQVDMMLPAALEKGFRQWPSSPSLSTHTAPRVYAHLRPRILRQDYDLIWIEQVDMGPMSLCEYSPGFWRSWLDCLADHGVLMVLGPTSIISAGLNDLENLRQIEQAQFTYTLFDHTDNKSNATHQALSILLVQRGKRSSLDHKLWKEILEPIAYPPPN